MDRPRDALAEGTELAGYVIGRVLGRGGFGITYLATDALFPAVRVAIKEFLPSGLAVRDPGDNSVHPASAEKLPDYAKALARFEDEARTLVALRHPAIVEAQRFIKANRTAYVVMKYEEGTSLGRRIANGATVPAAEIAKILPPLLDGLEQIHARAFIHRDIKPDNIYLRTADGSPVLLDFGAARQAMAEHRKTSLTEIVTPGYAPYEQYDRTSAQGPYTDIYALGATLYRCVTGEKAAEALARVTAAARRQPDPMPPARSAARGEYSPALLAAIDRALAVFENDRPQSIAEFRRLLAGEAPPVAASADPAAAESTLVAGAPVPPPRSNSAPSERPAELRPRRLARVLVAGLTAFVLVGGSYYAWSEYRAGEEARRLAAQDDARRAEEARRAAAERRRKEADEERTRAEAEAKRKAEDEARKRQEQEETKRRFEREDAKADARSCESGQDADAIAACTRIIDRGGTAQDLASAYSRRAFRYVSLKQYGSAIKDSTRAIELKSDFARAYHVRGYAHHALNERQRAMQDYDKAIELKPNDGDIYRNRGDTFGSLRQYQRAIRDYDKAIELNPADARAYLNRGGTYVDLKRDQRAIQDYDKAIELKPDYTLAYAGRGAAYTRLKQFQRAIQDHDKAIELDPAGANTHYNRGTTYVELKQYQRAIRDYDKAIALKPDYADPYLNRGFVYSALKQYRRAIQDFDKGIELSPADARAHHDRGSAYANLKQYKRAIRDYDKAIELKPEFAHAYYNRGVSYQNSGNRAAAIRDYREALRLGLDPARQALRKLGVER